MELCGSTDACIYIYIFIHMHMYIINAHTDDRFSTVY